MGGIYNAKHRNCGNHMNAPFIPQLFTSKAKSGKFERMKESFQLDKFLFHLQIFSKITIDRGIHLFPPKPHKLIVHYARHNLNKPSDLHHKIVIINMQIFFISLAYIQMQAYTS